MTPKLATIISIIVAILVAAYFVFVRPVGEVAQSPSPSPSATPDETAGWQTYRNDSLKEYPLSGYSIRHPFDWQVAVREEKTNDGSLTLAYLVTISRDNYFIEFSNPFAAGGTGCVFSGEFDPSTLAIDLRDRQYVEIEVNGVKLRRYQETETRSQDEAIFTFCSEQNENFALPTEFGFLWYRVPKNFDPNIIEIMDSIVGTIREGSPATGTSSWLTYRNEEYGFEVKYPADWPVNVSNGTVCFGNATSEESPVCAFMVTSYVPSSASLSIEELVRKREEQAPAEKAKYISVGGQPGILIWDEAYIEYLDKIYVLSSPIAANPELEEIFTDILSTFRFIPTP